MEKVPSHPAPVLFVTQTRASINTPAVKEVSLDYLFVCLLEEMRRNGTDLASQNVSLYR